MIRRIDHLARALSEELQFKPNTGSEWDKVVGVFSLNTVQLNPPLRAEALHGRGTLTDSGRLIL
jgi:hypothetical protein